jgi:alcohol dehydrogenase class IV
VTNALEALKSKTSGVKVIDGTPFAQDVLEFVQALGASPTAILAIGGGSVTDFSKAIASYFMYGAIDAVGLHGQIPKAVAPKPLLVSVPTTAGSGAEASRYFVTYDRHDHHKMFGKSWNLVADWVMLEPSFLESMPEDILVSCAFDAFVHLFETLVCQHERSWIGDMFSLNGIAQVMDALDRAIYHGERNDNVHCMLMQSATLGGVAISNVRTGNMHEAAGALLELTNLNHPETLYVFFRDVIEQYKHAITERKKLLLAHLRLIPHFEKFNTIDDIIEWWEAIFCKVGLDKKVRDRLKSCSHPVEKVSEHVFQRVFADKVWINKESPVVLDEKAIRLLIDRSFARFGFVSETKRT